ncbi:hypothetical protein GIB67_010236 [Kingdonia uniflora]|uniref:Helitron helicase n=1 Tax=Kingdonia uniflora TaxID=39325 RepID=A0A7J7NAT4_9MAGN|nr:hypothetical protein GIB67_010236 [Kingdonia uniflora]
MEAIAEEQERIQNSYDCGVAPSEILGIDETSSTATRLRNPIVETEESSRGPIDMALLPDLGKQVTYVQLYIYDSASTLNARVSRHPQLNTDVLKIIQDNLMEYNPFVQIYRQAYEVLNDAYSADNKNVNVHAHLHYRSRTYRRRYNLSSTDEITVILPRDGQEDPSTRDIVVYLRGGDELMRISECHPAYLPMHYVLLFPHREMGWEPEMKKWDVNYNRPTTKRLTQMDYYSYQLFQHPIEYSTILRSGKLF